MEVFWMRNKVAAVVIAAGKYDLDAIQKVSTRLDSAGADVTVNDLIEEMSHT